MSKHLCVGLVCAVIAGLAARGVEAAPCSAVTRSNLVSCALAASLERDAGRAGVQAAEGRIRQSEPWFPSDPRVELGLSSRENSENQSAVNWSASLELELEIGGRRSALRSAAVAEKEAEAKRLGATERRIAADAFELFFHALAARETAAVLAELDSASSRVGEAARAAAERGVASGVDADIAEVMHLRVVRRRIEAERDRRLEEAALKSLLGIASDAPLPISGSLTPLASAERVPSGVNPKETSEVLALEAERRAFSERSSAFRRSRVPNPALSVFVQRDGFDENVIGVGLGFPLPLPGPLGHSHSGEIAESEALARRAGLLAERGRREARLDLVRALESYRAAVEMERTFGSERLAQARATLQNLTQEVQAGRLVIRDAILLQEPLLELLLGAIEARETLCIVSVQVVRAAGASFERGEP